MNIGLREHKSASLRVAVPEALPEEMREHVREIVGVKSEERQQGHARALMYEVCTEADGYWITLFLHAKPFADGMTQEQIERWYAKHGFVKIQDHTDDGAHAVLMARSPKLPAIQRIQ